MKSTMHFIAHNEDQAWSMAEQFLSHDIDYDVCRSKNAGYPIYYSTFEGCMEWVSVLGDRLEINQADGNTVNIWIEEDSLLRNLVKKAQEFGYTAG